MGWPEQLAVAGRLPEVRRLFAGQLGVVGLEQPFVLGQLLAQVFDLLDQFVFMLLG
jgi:hypothetical protein